ncbi:hypothetical protein [Pseudomonas syringae]|uniref:hypothetical protein n=1 Tax=Pseudomonas syringae TaxID=317 RepID=UPI0009433D5E
MQLLPSRVFCYTLLLVTGWLIVSHIDVLFSQSVDLAHHYALAYRIAENFNLTSSNDPTLGEMNYYPRLSHIAAAIVGWPLHSTFLGLQIVSLLSLAIIWGAYIYMLSTLPRRVATVSTVALVLLLVLNRYAFKFDVHGAEIVGNYFYSQLVGQAVALLSIAVAIFLEVRKGRGTAYVFLVGVIAFNTGVHLLPTLELLGLLGGLVAFNGYLNFAEKKSGIGGILASFLIPAAGLCGVLLNPAFSAMRKISENDGALDFANISYPTGVTVLCLAGMVSSIVLLWLHVRNKTMLGYTAIKYLALYGGAVSCLCLLQMVLVKFGMGSDYAVKKYVFGMVSYLVVALAVMSAYFFCKRHVSKLDVSFNRSFLYALFTAVSFCVVFNTSLIPRERHDVSDLVQMEKKLDVMASQVPTINNGKDDVVIGLNGLSPVFDYLYSIAVFKTKREVAIPDVLVANNVRDYAGYNRVVTSAGVSKYSIEQCKVSSGKDIVVMDAGCLSDHLNQAGHCEGRVDFSTNGLIDSRNLKGFSSAESTGTWILDGNAEFRCKVGGRAPSTMILDWRPFVSSQHAKQAVKVFINGVEVYSAALTKPEFTTTEVKLPAISGDKMVVTISAQDSVSPQQLGMSEDARSLSVFVKSIEFK